MPDVLVVGGGPAGACAATILARAGARVRLIDRATFPRDKLCGDTINPGALAVLRRLGMAAAVSRRGLPVEGMIVTGPAGRRIQAAYPVGEEGRALLRRDLDALILQEADRAGVDVEQGTVVRGAIVEHHRSGASIAGVMVVAAHGRDAELRARVTIAADGRHSTLAFALGLARHPERPRRWAIGGYFAGAHGMSRFGEMHIRRARYIGVASLPGGLANVCLVTADRATLAQPSASLVAAVAKEPLLRERFADAALVAPAVSLGPLAVETRAAGMPGLLLAGDAAGFIDPMTGDGLRFALRGGELAAAAALDALAGRGRSPERQLQRARAREFAGKWRFNRTLRALVDAPLALRFVETAASRLPALIQHVVITAADVPPPAVY